MTSDLVARFLARAGTPNKAPEEVICELVRKVAKRCPKHGPRDSHLQFLLRQRNVKFTERLTRSGAAGALEPLGTSFRDGFRLLIDPQTTETRRRFTLAHELCHTFFYELVPEIKFRPHDVFSDEERLCDVGASELLMPAASVRKNVKGSSVSIEDLEALAAEYLVSKSAMLLRLRALGYWKCEMTEWHRMRDGTFSLLRVIGGLQRPWEFEDDTVLAAAWDLGRSTGTTHVMYRDERGVSFHRPPVRFQMKRFADKLIALWGPDVCIERRHPSVRPLPLFGK